MPKDIAGVPLKLIDQIGTETDSIAWLESKGVAKGLPVRDWKKRKNGVLGLFGMASAAVDLCGAPGLAHLIDLAATWQTERPMDGLQALWIASPRD